jgi:hypothetical protein
VLWGLTVLRICRSDEDFGRKKSKLKIAILAMVAMAAEGI